MLVADSSQQPEGSASTLRALGRAAPLFVVASLVLLFLAPLGIGARVLDARSLRSEVQEPAHLALGVIQLTVVSQGMAMRAYAVAPPEGRAAFLEEYQRARVTQREAFEALLPLLPRLEPSTQDDIISLRRALLGWHETHEAWLATHNSGGAPREAPEAHEGSAREVRARANAALHSLQGEVATTRQRLEWLTRLQVVLTSALAALALLSIFVALWLGDRGRRLDVALADHAVAEQLAAARADVLSWVSHDLKNPLAAIRMACTNLRRSLEKNPERAPRIVDSIDRSALRMSRLIGDVLDSARLDAGRALVMDARAVDLGALITRTCGEAEQQPGVDVKVRCSIEDRLPAVRGDKLRLEQALLNLVQNAIRVSPSDASVEVSAERVDDFVKVSVRDRGPGISDEQKPLLFQRFRTAQRGEGSGLGLSIVKGVVEAHGGDVWFETQNGDGTTFFFTVPTMEAAGAASEAAPPST